LSIRKSRARIIYCRILDSTLEKADSDPNVIYIVCDFGTHAPDIGQTLPDSHYHGMCSGRRSAAQRLLLDGYVEVLVLYLEFLMDVLLTIKFSTRPVRILWTAYMDNVTWRIGKCLVVKE